MSDEKRHFHRVGHDAAATLRHAGQTWTCTVMDLSLNGCLIELVEENPVEPERKYHLDIHLSPSIHIEMDATLSHQDGRHVGLHCVGIDSDSVGQLRRLIELNLGDSALLERDMRELIRG